MNSSTCHPDKPTFSKGQCRSCYLSAYWRARGQRKPPRAAAIPAEKRLEMHSDRSGGPNACWIWTGSRTNWGYPQVHNRSARRITWELMTKATLSRKRWATEQLPVHRIYVATVRKRRHSGWKKLSPVECDMCSASAIWRHPAGGFRCGQCPRPSQPSSNMQEPK